MSVYRKAVNLKEPHNQNAIDKANQAFAAKHGSIKPTMAPSDAALRKEWMDTYVAAGGDYVVVKPSGKKPGDVSPPCLPPPATPHPTKTFATAEEAAVAAMKEANPNSVKEGREYGGWVHKNSDGTFSYDPPVQGSKDGLTNMPSKGASDEVWYHTHGAADPGYDNENFSGATGDKGYSNANSAVGYVATPSGAIKKYDPATGTETTLGDTAPP